MTVLDLCIHRYMPTIVHGDTYIVIVFVKEFLKDEIDHFERIFCDRAKL